MLAINIDAGKLDTGVVSELSLEVVQGQRFSIAFHRRLLGGRHVWRVDVSENRL
jgi:hypothetical protein